jgi:uncharacterized membrane protein
LAVVRGAALAAGALAAAIALYGRYRVLPAALTGPEVCRREAGGCQVLFRTREASLLGVPNAALGLILYGVIALGLVWDWPRAWLLAAATPALGISILLGRYLLSRRLECRICWVGHVANALLWAALLTGLVTGEAR